MKIFEKKEKFEFKNDVKRFFMKFFLDKITDYIKF